MTEESSAVTAGHAGSMFSPMLAEQRFSSAKIFFSRCKSIGALAPWARPPPSPRPALPLSWPSRRWALRRVASAASRTLANASPEFGGVPFGPLLRASNARSPPLSRPSSLGAGSSFFLQQPCLSPAAAVCALPPCWQNVESQPSQPIRKPCRSNTLCGGASHVLTTRPDPFEDVAAG